MMLVLGVGVDIRVDATLVIRTGEMNCVVSIYLDVRKSVIRS